MPVNQNNPANIYTSAGQAREDKAPDFGDFLTAAAEKQQERAAEKNSPEKVKRVYTMSPGQKKSLRRKYGSARFSQFEVVIDNDRIYCNNPTLTEFTRQLWEMGMLTPEEAELGAGKRPLPRDVFTAEFRDKTGDKGGALIVAGEDYLYDNSGWIDLLYPRRIPESVGDYFAYQEIILTSLRIYLSNPSAAIASVGEYFAFDPFQIRECLAAVQKISALWADTAMKDKNASSEKKRTFYRERPAPGNIGSIIDRKLPEHGRQNNSEAYGNATRENVPKNSIGNTGKAESPARNASDFYGNAQRNGSADRPEAYKNVRQSETDSFKDIDISRNEQAGEADFSKNEPRENVWAKGEKSFNEKPRENISRNEQTGSPNPFRRASENEDTGNNAGNRADNRAVSYKNASRKVGTGGSSAYGNISRENASRTAPSKGAGSYPKPSENEYDSDAFREVSLEEAAGNAEVKFAEKNPLPYKEIPRDPIIHQGAAGRAKAYREIPGERSGRIEAPEAYREPPQKEKPSPEAKAHRKETSADKNSSPSPADKVAAYREMLRERKERRGGKKGENT